MVTGMWVEVRRASSLMIAEMWRELLEGEGIPTRILPDPKDGREGEFGHYRIYVPKFREHVVDEIVRRT